jgi:hypothetical protein
VWALASLKAFQPSDALIQRLHREITHKAERFRPQELANSLWALSVLGDAPPPPTSLLRAIDKAVGRQAGGMKPGELAMVRGGGCVNVP